MIRSSLLESHLHRAEPILPNEYLQRKIRKHIHLYHVTTEDMQPSCTSEHSQLQKIKNL